MPARNDRGQFVRDDWFRMFEKKQPLSSVYDKYVTPCDCQCPIIRPTKTNITDENGRPKGWFDK